LLGFLARRIASSAQSQCSFLCLKYNTVPGNAFPQSWDPWDPDCLCVPLTTQTLLVFGPLGERCFTPALAEPTEYQICEAISYGLTDEEVAALVGIDDSTLTRWKKDPEFCGAIKSAVAARKLVRLKRIESGESGWQGTAWAMERQFPDQFSAPEVQLRLKLVLAAKANENRNRGWVDRDQGLKDSRTKERIRALVDGMK
jgi:hypothetical protein